MSDQLNDELNAIMAKENDIQKQVQNYHRKLMHPIWTERREVVKKIPNFWSDAISHAPMFNIAPKDNDLEALEHLEDFHVEYDENRPNYRKVVAHFKKNDLFKNESLTKEFIMDEDEGSVISKSTIDYHSGKEPNNKRKADEVDDDEFDFSFLNWFGDDSLPTGAFLTEELFPSAIEYYRGDDDDEDEDDEIELGSDSEEDDAEDESPKKKAKK